MARRRARHLICISGYLVEVLAFGIDGIRWHLLITKALQNIIITFQKRVHVRCKQLQLPRLPLHGVRLEIRLCGSIGRVSPCRAGGGSRVPAPTPRHRSALCGAGCGLGGGRVASARGGAEAVRWRSRGAEPSAEAQRSASEAWRTSLRCSWSIWQVERGHRYAPPHGRVLACCPTCFSFIC